MRYNNMIYFKSQFLMAFLMAKINKIKDPNFDRYF